jgi:hypothetical protein
MVHFGPFGQNSLHIFHAGWAKKVQAADWAGRKHFAMMR